MVKLMSLTSGAERERESEEKMFSPFDPLVNGINFVETYCDFTQISFALFFTFHVLNCIVKIHLYLSFGPIWKDLTFKKRVLT